MFLKTSLTMLLPKLPPCAERVRLVLGDFDSHPHRSVLVHALQWMRETQHAILVDCIDNLSHAMLLYSPFL